MKPRSSALALCALIGACASVDQELLTNEGPVQDIAPAPLTIAIGPIADPEAKPSEGDLRFVSDGEALRRQLIEHLVDLRAASQIVEAADGAAANEARADVFISPTPDGSVSISHRGTNGRWWSSGGLWLVTWFGGLLVEASTYDTNLRFKCSLNELKTSMSTEFPAASGPVDLSFLDRNSLLSWSGLQSLILPPFWTSDQSDSTSAELTGRATRAAAARIAEFLKLDFPHRSIAEGLGELVDLRPSNGSTVAFADIELSGKVVAKQEFSEAFLSVGDGPFERIVLRPTMEIATKLYSAPLGFIVPASRLESGKPNFVRITVAIGGELLSRTLRFDVR